MNLQQYIDDHSYLDSLRAIYLLLGPACNMSCRHCTQTPIKNTFFLRPEDSLSEDIVSFIKTWSKIVNETYKVIYFWGGEPLLYWDTIKQCISLFESKNIQCNYRIFSNGLLLNDEIVNFCNAHRIAFTLSYDAPNPLAARSAVPSKENILCFLKINNRTVNSVFNAINNNLVDAFNILEKIFPGTKITIGIINVLYDIPKDLYDFKDGEIEKAIHDLADEIIDGNDPYGNREEWFLVKIRSWNSFNLSSFIEYPFPPCWPGTISLSMKFNGDIVRCHNDNIVISNIKYPCKTIYQDHLTLWKNLLPEACLTCDVLPICRNRCPIALMTEDKKEFVNCTIYRRIYSSIMENFQRIKEHGQYRE